MKNVFDSILNKGWGILLLRLFVGFRLIYGTMDNVWHWDRMIEFSQFLEAQKFPYPLVCAVISVYAQFICGILIILGFYIRWVSAIMIINFIIATSIHISEGIPAMTPPLLILLSCFLFLLEGSGPLSLRSKNIQ